MVNGLSGYYDIGATNGVTVRIFWNEKYDTDTNKHQILITNLQLKTSYTYGYLYYLDGSIKVNGSNVVTFSSSAGSHSVWGYTSSFSSVETNGGYDPVPWDSIVFNGNNDGTSSTSISVNIQGYTISGEGDSGWSAVNSKNITLTSIPRQSNISSVSNVILGNNCSVKWIPNSKTFYYKLRFYIGNWNHTTGAIHPNITSLYDYNSYTIPISVSNQIINKETGNMTVSLTTYSDSACKNKIGSVSSKTFIATVPSNIVPSISNLNVDVINTNQKLKEWDIAVAGYSSVKFIATATGSYGSSIRSFYIKEYEKRISGTSLNYQGEPFSKSGNIKFGVSCKDSRNRDSSYTYYSIDFLPYSIPKITEFYAKRNDNGSVSVKANWSISSLGNRNNSVCKLYYKKNAELSWKEYGVISKNIEQVLSASIEQTSSYNFKIIVTDELGNSSEQRSFVSTIEVLIDLKSGGKGLGIGKIAETDSLEVALPSTFSNSVGIGKVAKNNNFEVAIPSSFDSVNSNSLNSTKISIGSKEIKDFVVEEGTNGIWKYKKWNNGMAECWCSVIRNGLKFTNDFPVSGIHFSNIQLFETYPLNFFKGPEKPKCYSSYIGAYDQKTGKTYHSMSYPTKLSTLSKTNEISIMRIGDVSNLPELSAKIEYYIVGKWK